MKKKKSIIISNPQLKRVRDNLRLILGLAVSKKLVDLINQMHAINTDTKENYEIRWSLRRDIDSLRSSRSTSIIQCASCNAMDRDLKLNPIAGGWFCLECYKMYREVYYKTMEKKRRGEFIGSDYDEEFARSFIDD